ncbi:MAG: hypothetical protein QXP73_06140 [Candidatus Methanomethylicaceae archaeon]
MLVRIPFGIFADLFVMGSDQTFVYISMPSNFAASIALSPV